VEALYGWFQATHELTPTAGGVMWHRIALPAAGAVGDQDAKLMDALDYLRTVTNKLLWQRQPARAASPAEPEDASA
jgi:hypothetical protein